jgi:hypothetical protein
MSKSCLKPVTPSNSIMYLQLAYPPFAGFSYYGMRMHSANSSPIMVSGACAIFTYFSSFISAQIILRDITHLGHNIL